MVSIDNGLDLGFFFLGQGPNECLEDLVVRIGAPFLLFLDLLLDALKLWLAAPFPFCLRPIDSILGISFQDIVWDRLSLFNGLLYLKEMPGISYGRNALGPLAIAPFYY